MRKRRLMNEINVVPYIDVMLVLLVIFMVTAPMIQPGSVDLPSVGKSSLPPAAPLEVIIKADTSLALRDRSKGGAEQVVARADLAASHFNLLEKLTEHIATWLLENFAAQWVRVSVAKLGMMPGVKRVGVIIERSI